jgi:apolipoprotein N-acyltransferase
MYRPAIQASTRPPLARVWVWAATLFSAGLLAQAQPPASLGWLAAVALVPWALAMRGVTALRAALCAGMLGLVYGLLVSSWIPEALEVRGARHMAASFGWWVAALWAGALPFAILGGCVQALERFGPRVQIPASAALAFALDTLRSHFVVGVPWALLGHSQASHLGVAQIAAVGGVPLVSAFLVALNLALARMFHPGRTPPETAAALGGIAAWVALAAAGVPVAEALHSLASDETSTPQPMRALLARHRLRHDERWIETAQRAHLDALLFHTERAMRRAPVAPDLVVWPENSLTTPLERDPELERELLAAVRRLGVDVVLGTIALESGFEPNQAYRSVTLWVSPERGVLDTFAKTIGVPIVETAASGRAERTLRKLFGIDAAARALVPAREERPLRGRFEVATALCFEAIYPFRIAARRTSATRALLNPSSDAWLRDASAVSAQLTAYASFRAIEQRLPLIRVSDAGTSVAFDSFGRRRATLPASRSGGVWVEIPSSAPLALVERAGLALFPALVATLFAVACAAGLRRRCARERDTPSEDDDA